MGLRTARHHGVTVRVITNGRKPIGHVLSVSHPDGTLAYQRGHRDMSR